MSWWPFGVCQVGLVTSGVTHRWTGPVILGAIILTCPLLVAEPVGVGSMVT